MVPTAFAVRDGAEEGRDGWEVGFTFGPEGGEEFVEEGGGAVEQEGLGAVVEVSILGDRLLVALVAVEGEVFAVEVPLAGVLHVAEEGAVEVVVVADGREDIVVAGEGGITFEFLVGGRNVSRVRWRTWELGG